MLFAASLFNILDRQIFGILIEPIKLDLNLSDSAMGFISGIAFAVLYTTLGIPLGRYADTANRRNIIGACVALWSAMTVVSGLALNFTQLALARVGVSIGQAGLSPAAHSLVSDYFPANKRATALSIYAQGALVGTVFMFLIGGWAAEVFSWRVAFVIVGLPGVALSLIIFLTVREPPRGHAEGKSATAAAPPMLAVFAYLWNVRSFRHLALGNGFFALAAYGIMQWLSPFLIRSHGYTVGETGLALSAVMVFGAIGTLAGGYLSDRLAVRNRRWYLLLPALAVGCALLLYVSAYLTPSGTTAVYLLGTAYFVMAMELAPLAAMVQALSSLRMRALASAVFQFVTNIIGIGIGPQMVGVLSDLLEPSFGQHSLRYASIAVTLFFAPAALHFWLSSRTLVQDLDRVPG